MSASGVTADLRGERGIRSALSEGMRVERRFFRLSFLLALIAGGGLFGCEKRPTAAATDLDPSSIIAEEATQTTRAARAMARSESPAAHDRRGWLGIRVADNHSANAADHVHEGARIERVIPQLAADQAGLDRGDIILAVNEVPISGPDQLLQTLRQVEPLERIEITVCRHGEHLQATPRLDPMEEVIAQVDLKGRSSVSATADR